MAAAVLAVLLGSVRADPTGAMPLPLSLPPRFRRQKRRCGQQQPLVRYKSPRKARRCRRWSLASS